MSYLVVLNLGTGNCQQGFPCAIAQLWEENKPTPMQFTGSLPPIPEFATNYQQWQAQYTALYSHLGWRKNRGFSNFEFDDADVTNVSQSDFNQLCQSLHQTLNRWLNSESFRLIDQNLRTRLTPNDEVRLIIAAEDPTVLRLPWCLWDFFVDYPKAEIALSPAKYTRSLKAATLRKNKIQILGILGDSQGINVTDDQQLLQKLPNTDITFLIEPTAQQLNQHLWQPGWDILFFAGHSSSEQSGILHLNNHDSLTIEQLKYGLRTAIANGLKLAIFNSCDGLGLAQDLADLSIPQVIVMREPVPDSVAQTFLKNFLIAFAGGQSLYTSVRQSREQLQALETEFPCATWLPIICQNPAELPPKWEDWCAQPKKKVYFPTRREWQTILVSSVAIAACTLGIRSFGLLQPVELWAFDQLMRLRPAENPDDRLLVVKVTEQDIQAQGSEPRKGSLSDRTLNQLLEKLNQHKPAAIGLDIYRDYPSTLPALTKQLQTNDRFVIICKRPDTQTDPDGITPPPEVPEQRAGFSDFVQDPGRIIRRQLLFVGTKSLSQCSTSYSLGLQIAFRYLHDKSIQPTFTQNGDLQFGQTVLRRLTDRTSGYQPVDARGNQLMINYRATPTIDAIAPQITLSELLKGEVNPSSIQGRIILIGVTVPNRGDYWSTPYGATVETQVPGVLIHAQMISQILSSVLDRRPLIWAWTPIAEGFWIGVWSLGGGLIGWRFRRLNTLGSGLAIASAGLAGSCYVLLLGGGWIPLVPPMTTLMIAASIVAYISISHSKP